MNPIPFATIGLLIASNVFMGASKNVAISPRFGRMVGVGGMIED